MNFSVGPTVQNLTIFRGKNRKFWLGLKWLRMTQGAQKSPRNGPPMKIQLLLTFDQPTRQILTKLTKTKWNFDYGSNDSEWPRELKNHLGFDLRWKFNFCSLLPKPLEILKKWTWKPSGMQRRAKIDLKIGIRKSGRPKCKFRNRNLRPLEELWFWKLDFETEFELELDS